MCHLFRLQAVILRQLRYFKLIVGFVEGSFLCCLCVETDQTWSVWLLRSCTFCHCSLQYKVSMINYTWKLTHTQWGGSGPRWPTSTLLMSNWKPPPGRIITFEMGAQEKTHMWCRSSSPLYYTETHTHTSPSVWAHYSLHLSVSLTQRLKITPEADPPLVVFKHPGEM